MSELVQVSKDLLSYYTLMLMHEDSRKFRLGMLCLFTYEATVINWFIYKQTYDKVLF